MKARHSLFLATALIAAAAVFVIFGSVPAISQTDSETRAADVTSDSDIATVFITENGTLDCAAIASELDGIPVPNGDVCDVVVVRQSPEVIGHNNITLNQFTLMNSVLEFLPVTNETSNSTEVYVMGDFALLETEMNSVLQIVTANNWTVTGVHNHMINEEPKMSFMHWEVQGDIATIIENANEAFAATSIKEGPPGVDEPGANATSAVTFKEEMRELWVDHIVYTRQFIVDTAGDLPSLNQTTERLLENQKDIGDAVKPYYGEEAGNQLTGLLNDHILIAADLVNAAKAGNDSTVADAEQRWSANADEIAAFLANANPNWDEGELSDMLHDHLNVTEAEAVARLEGSYLEDITTFDEVHEQAMNMADTLSDGLIEQFPARFNDNGTNADTASAVTFKEEMRELWVDHIVYTRQFIVDTAGDLPSLNQTTERLLENQKDIGDAVKPYYGEEAGNNLTALLEDHILIAADLVNAAKEGNDTAVQEANEAWLQNADDIAAFLADANPNWSEDELRDMLHRHLDVTAQEAVARLQGDYVADIEAFDEVHDQAMEMADELSEGILEQFPDRFE